MARTTEHCERIAPLLAIGRSVAYISNELGLSRGIIRIRLETMRLVLADELSDTSWLDVERRTAVEVGQAWETVTDRIGPPARLGCNADTGGLLIEIECRRLHGSAGSTATPAGVLTRVSVDLTPTA